MIGSSDNHRGQPGTGHKEVRRKFMTEAFGSDNPRFAQRAAGDRGEAVPYSVPADTEVGLQNLRNMERQNSFWLTGGLVAVHSEGRSREAIWNSLKRKEVYATSGDRILLWFTMEAEGKRVSMGGEASSAQAPSFKASAVGAFRQKPGCPANALGGAGKQRIEAFLRR
jgi:hypothetical protein